MKVLFHSDDFGISDEQVEAIFSCAEHGCLGSVSVLANSPHLREYLAALPKRAPRLLAGVHVNFVEGRCTAPAAEIPLLAGSDGLFSNSYSQLFFRSLLPGRGALKAQMKREALAQIAAVRAALPAGAPLRLDTHQHTHAIPLVFDAILETVRENGLPVSYLRMPFEPIRPFLRHPRVLLQIPIENYAKQALLFVFYLINRKKLAAAGIPSASFSGVLLTGGVAAKTVERVLPALLDYARARGADLEILFHPGRVRQLADCPDANKKEFVRFNLSPHREAEFAMLHEIAPFVERLRAAGQIE